MPGTEGIHPVVVLSPGLQQPAAAYHDYGHRLASYGIITLVRDDPGLLVNSADEATDISYVVATWLPAANADATSMLAGQIDLAHVGLAGHSRGGKSSLIAAETGAAGKVGAWFGLDPVDAAFINGGVQARDQIRDHRRSDRIPRDVGRRCLQCGRGQLPGALRRRTIAVGRADRGRRGSHPARGPGVVRGLHHLRAGNRR